MSYNWYKHLVYCDNCECLKGVCILGKKLVWHKPCKPVEFDMYSLQRCIAPPGYISTFMRKEATKISPIIGPYLQVFRIDPDANLKFTMSYFSDPEKVTLAPEPKIDRLRINRFLNAFGAKMRYVIEFNPYPEVPRLYYVDTSNQNQACGKWHARDYLKQVMNRCAAETDHLHKVLESDTMHI